MHLQIEAHTIYSINMQTSFRLQIHREELSGRVGPIEKQATP